MATKEQSLKSKYKQLTSKRESCLTRAEEYAKATLPYVMKDVEDQTNAHGWQGFGAKVVNHLSNQIIMTLFPPSRAFFKLGFSSKVRKELKELGWESDDLASELSDLEQDAMTYMAKTTPRDLDIKTCKHLIITGNYMQYFPNKDEPAIGVGLDQYVVKRDAHGNLVEVVLKQEKVFSAMPDEVQDAIKAERKNSHIKAETNVELYTAALKQKDGKFKIKQEAANVTVGKEYEVKEKKLPFNILMWNHTHGEDYGRGLVEDHAGDFHVIQLLSEAMAKGMVLMSDVKYLVKPGGYTDIEHIVSSPAGEFVSGNIDDIGVLQLEKYADFSPISEVLQKYEQRVGEAFMVARAARRQAERVTAYEIRQDASDLEISLGGVYSHLSNIWQKPRAEKLLEVALRNSDTELKTDDFEPEIITGTEALGRMDELDKIMQFTEILQMPNTWPEPMQQKVRWDRFSGKVAAEIGLDIDWLMSDEEYAQLQQQQQQQAQQQKIMEEASKAAPDIVKDELGDSNE